MIKSNELRVGNFCLRTDVPGGLWHEIRSISRDQLHPINTIEQDFKNNVYYSSDCKLENVDPIILDEDMLINFGFEFDGECYEPPILGSKYKFIIYEGEDVDEYRMHFSPSKYIPIYYVHQLQNLYFALTGSELKYNP